MCTSVKSQGLIKGPRASMVVASCGEASTLAS